MPSVSDDLAVKVDNLSITYRTTIEKNPTLVDRIRRFGRSEKIVQEVKAVQDASWQISHGTVLGVIGANGAGKSTMLRAIAGILPPTKGRIEVHGRVSTLLALGVGFNGQLSGRENITLGGLAQGWSPSEIKRRSQEIIDFAALEDGAIERPMRTYSSGMYGRLAFSLAVHMDPDILLVDEALSAGDARFKRTANAKMRELVDEARTIIMVSHGLASIQELCNDCLWLHKGKVMARGKPDEVIKKYTHFLDVGEDAFTMEDV